MMNDNRVFDISKFNSFGDVAAEDDAVLDYFVSTDAVKKIESGSAFLVLGRKGTGKTAIVRYFTEKNFSSTAYFRPDRQLTLRGYPWKIHAKRIDRGASDIDAYISSWKYLIAIELSSIAISHPKSSLSIHASGLEKYLRENYGALSPNIEDILRPTKLKTSGLTIAPQIMGYALGGVNFERNDSDLSLGRELDAVTDSILHSFLDVARAAKIEFVRLHFDELDQGLSNLDEDRKKILIGLIVAARDIRRECSRDGIVVNPIVYLRTDIWDDLQFSDKNKISQTMAMNIVWSEDSLLDLVNARLDKKLESGAKLNNICDEELMRGSQSKWRHIIARTFLRPRDVIRFLNSILVESKRRQDRPLIIINRDIVNSRNDYSAYLKSELDDEIQPHWSTWTEALQACSALSTITFDRADFLREYDFRRSSENQIRGDEALAVLYRFSVIGYENRSGYGGSGWVFQYSNPESRWDEGAKTFKVHQGLKEYARLRETRQ